MLFRAHTEPELLVQRLGSPRPTIDYYDVRHVGARRYIHRDADGTEYGFRGVPSVDGITQTFELEGVLRYVSRETLTVEGRDGATDLPMRSVYQSLAARDAILESGMESGVNDSMDRLEELIVRRAATA